MKIRNIIKVRNSLNNLAKVLLPKNVDNYTVFKIYKQIEEEIQNYNVQKDKIVLKYGTQKSGGGISISQDNPNYTIALKAISELEDIEVDIRINSIIIYPDDVKLCPADLLNLEEFGLIKLVEEVGE